MKRLLTLVVSLILLSGTSSSWRAGASPDDPLSAGKQDRATVKDISPDAQDLSPSDDERTIYTNRRKFDLPVSIDPKARPMLREVRLYVSEDRGKTYRQTEAASSKVEKFRFRALRDGFYWFTVQTVDARGIRIPTDVQREDPALMVCVDTQPPRVRLKASRRRKAILVEWEVHDRNLDVQSLRLEFRAGGAETWTTLPAAQKAISQYRWNPPKDSRLEVRLRVSDKAGNAGEATVTVNAKEAE